MALRRQGTYTQRCLLLFLFLILISLLTVGTLAEPSFLPLTKVVRRTAESEDQSLEQWLQSVYASASQLIRHRYARVVKGRVGGRGLVQLMALCSLIGACGIWGKRRIAQREGYAATGSHDRRLRRSVVDSSNRNSPGESR